MTIQPVGRPKYDARQKLIAATRELLSERGYSATSPKMILKRAKLGQGSLYYHFAGKDELAVATIESMAQASLRAVKRGFAQPASPETLLGMEPANNYAADATLAQVSVRAGAVLREVFRHRDGRALVRLLADPALIDSSGLAEPVAVWATLLRDAVVDELSHEAVEACLAWVKIQCNRAFQRVIGEQLLEGLALIARDGERYTTRTDSSAAVTRQELCS